MRRAATSVAAAVFASLILPPLCTAGWRSADRPDRDDATFEEPCERDEPVDGAWQGDGRGDWQGERHDGERGGRVYRRNDRVESMVPQATQPYWGTMRPYWNSPEPAGVIHRQPRTAPLKIPKK